MNYRTIAETFWTDRLVKKELTRDEKFLFFYVITNQHSHYSGLYYISEAILMDETGLSKDELNGALRGLMAKGRVEYDYYNEVIWVVNMLEHQLKNGNRKNMIQGVSNHLETLHESPLIGKFLTRYKSLGIKFSVQTDKNYRSVDMGCLSHSEGYNTHLIPMPDGSYTHAAPIGGTVTVTGTVTGEREGGYRGEIETMTETVDGRPSASPPPPSEAMRGNATGGLPESTVQGANPKSRDGNLYGEFGNVRLSDEEYGKLLLLFGEKTAHEYIERLSGYLSSTGRRKYRDHYATIRNWLRGDKVEPLKVCSASNPMPRDEKNQKYWTHPDIEEGIYRTAEKPEGVKALRCSHCRKLVKILPQKEETTVKILPWRRDLPLKTPMGLPFTAGLREAHFNA